MKSAHTHASASGASHSLDDCIRACSACHETCERMVYQHCVVVGGKHVEADHLRLMADCAQICRTSADFMLRGSPRHRLTCRVCAEICEACAADCERVGGMDDCVQACRRCAESCRRMAA